MVAHEPRIEEHPDLLALRAESERVTARPAAQALECLSLLAALYVAVSPWVVGFYAGFRTLAVMDLILGAALTMFALGYGAAYERTHGMAWASALIGVWLCIAPWVISGSAHTTGPLASNVAAGTMVLLLALATIAMGMMGRRMAGGMSGRGMPGSGMGRRAGKQDAMDSARTMPPGTNLR